MPAKSLWIALVTVWLIVGLLYIGSLLGGRRPDQLSVDDLTRYLRIVTASGPVTLSTGEKLHVGLIDGGEPRSSVTIEIEKLFSGNGTMVLLVSPHSDREINFGLKFVRNSGHEIFLTSGRTSLPGDVFQYAGMNNLVDIGKELPGRGICGLRLLVFERDGDRVATDKRLRISCWVE